MSGDRLRMYDREFFVQRTPGSVRSAQIVLPLVFKHIRPVSVVDVGCGVGTWLAVCRQMDVADILGVDGSSVARSSLHIPTAAFVHHDLSSPLDLGRRFDLVVSLEVAEHLPASAAAPFVATLASLGDVVLFSAAIPHQGGTGHVNEQWPEYWADLFAEHDFAPADVIRPQIWYDENVDWWYRQNTLLYVRRACLAGYPTLATACRHTARCPLSIVHPQHFLTVLPTYRDPVPVAARALASAIKGWLIGRAPHAWPHPHVPHYYTGPDAAGARLVQ